MGGAYLRWEGDVATLSLEFPHGNAITLPMLRDLHHGLSSARDEGAAALVLTGRGSAFCVGLDVRESLRLSRAELAQFLHTFQHVLEGLYLLPMPVVAAINGHAAAGGCALALSADLRIGSSGPARIGLPELRLGLPFPAAVLAVVEHELGPLGLRRLLLRSELLDPPAALEAGLLDEVVAPEDLLPRAIAEARRLAVIGEAFSTIKGQVRTPVIEQLQERSEINDQWLDHWLSPLAQGRLMELLLSLNDGAPAVGAASSLQQS